MRVKCEVEEVEQENDYGKSTPSIEVTCPRCGHSTQGYGTSPESIRYCLVSLRNESPRVSAISM
jgi:hypothetical protein